MTIRPDYTHVAAKDQIASAENEVDAPKGDSLAYGGKLEASGRFLVRSARSRDGLEGRRRVVTVLFADPTLHLLPMGQLDVKGLPEGIEAFELLGPAGPGTRSPR